MKVTNKMIDRQLRIPGWVVAQMTRRRYETIEAVRKGSTKVGFFDKVIQRMVPESKGFSIERRRIPRPDGSEMRILIRRPLQEPRSNVAGILHLHGGGYHSGGPELALHCTKLFEAGDFVMVSPAYRLSVREPYPAALDDCYTALRWLQENAASLGVRNDQIAVMGESAGGGLTAATTLYARDRGEVNVAFQMPLCPMIDDRNNSPSAIDNDAPGWNAKTNEVGWKLYLGELWGTDQVPAYAAPARASNYSGLPPTYSYVGALDPFCSETQQYIENLRASGVRAELHVYDGAYHGFEIINRARIAQEARENLGQWFKHALANHTAPQPDSNQ